MSRLPAGLERFDRTRRGHPDYDDTPATEPMPTIDREAGIMDGMERLRLQWSATEIEFRAICERWVEGSRDKSNE